MQLPINPSLSRRDVLKLGIAAGGSTFFISKSLTAGLAGPQISKGGVDPGGRDGGKVPPARILRPWVSELPIQTPKAYGPSLMDTVNPDAHQRFWEFTPKHFYDLHVREADHQFHPDLPPTRIFGYDGTVPGALFHSRYGEPCLVRIFNDLPANHVGFGAPEISTHLHNSHTPSESDGFPGYFHGPGTYKDHHYPMSKAGGDEREALGTVWYHDHRLDFTAQNVYRGLAGFHLFFDDKDSGDEQDTNPVALRLPSGEFDVPMVFSDRVIGADGQLVFDMFNMTGILGDNIAVNGKIQPFMNVKRRKYRFRILDGGISRVYHVALSNSARFTHIANDGNLFERPLSTKGIWLGVAERADIVIDFSTYRKGDVVYLVNRAEQFDGRGPTGKLLTPRTPLVKFIIGDSAADPSQVPSFLRALPDINLAEVTMHRTWEFGRSNGAWTVNGKLFDVERCDARVKRGSAEIWTLRNGGGGWAHPIHIHFEEFQMLERNGKPVAPHERCRKDVALLFPGDEVKCYWRFRDFLGRYPMHCHNLVHEDHAMMVRWDIVDGDPS